MKVSTFGLIGLVIVVPEMVLAHGTQIPLSIQEYQPGHFRIVTHEWRTDGNTEIHGEDRLFTIPLSQYTGTATTAGWYGHQPAGDTTCSDYAHPGFAYGRSTFAPSSTLTVNFLDQAKVWDPITSTFIPTGGERIQGLRGGSLTSGFSNGRDSDGNVMGTGISITLPATLNVNSHATIRWRMLDQDGLPGGTIDDGIYMAVLQVSTDQTGVEASLPYVFLFTKNASSTDIASAEAFVNTHVIPEPSALAALGLILTMTLKRRRQH